MVVVRVKRFPAVSTPGRGKLGPSSAEPVASVCRTPSRSDPSRGTGMEWAVAVAMG